MLIYFWTKSCKYSSGGSDSCWRKYLLWHSHAILLYDLKLFRNLAKLEGFLFLGMKLKNTEKDHRSQSFWLLRFLKNPNHLYSLWFWRSVLETNNLHRHRYELIRELRQVRWKDRMLDCSHPPDLFRENLLPKYFFGRLQFLIIAYVPMHCMIIRT